MYIQSATIRNLRGFKKLELSFARPGGSYAGWTAVAGKNGSGKTTLLRAIALCLLDPSERTAFFNEVEWIRDGEDSGDANCQVLPSVADRFAEPDPDAFRSLGDPEQERGREAFLSGLRLLSPVSANFLAMRSRHVTLVSLATRLGPYRGGPESGWLLAGYGPVRRLGRDSDAVEALRKGHPRAARVATLFLADASLADSVTWLQNVRLEAYEEQSNVDGWTGSMDLLDGVKDLLNDGLLPAGFTIVDVTAKGLMVRRDGVTLPLTEFSDGYRAVVALVLDLVKQLHAAYGALRVDRSATGPCVPHEGVVLIDEPEAHLHVSWQKRLGFWFKRHFPAIQFIVATHSPYVCQAADANGLFRLPGPEEEGEVARPVSSETFRAVVNGDADEAVMSELFGLDSTHSDESERIREEVAALNVKAVRGSATPEEKARLRAQSALLPSSPFAQADLADRKRALVR